MQLWGDRLALSEYKVSIWFAFSFMRWVVRMLRMYLQDQWDAEQSDEISVLLLDRSQLVDPAISADKLWIRSFNFPSASTHPAFTSQLLNAVTNTR